MSVDEHRGLGLGFVAFAEEGPGRLTPTLVFHIPEQPLVTALQSYSEASGVHVMYESGAEIGERSVPIDGELTREAALKMLLGRSNLVARYARADTVALIDPATASSELPPDASGGGADMSLDMLHVPTPHNLPDQSALTEYIGVLQQRCAASSAQGGQGHLGQLSARC